MYEQRGWVAGEGDDPLPPPSLPPSLPSHLRPAHGVDQECFADENLQHVLPDVLIVLGRAKDQVAGGGREGGREGRREGGREGAMV